MKQIKVLLVDDHKIVRDGIQALLKVHEDIEVIAECNNGKDAIEVLQNQKADVVLMDINMPTMDGLEATERIVEQSLDTKVLALSMHCEHRFISKMLKVGAYGYLLKSTSGNQLGAAIRKAANGETYYCKEVTDIMMAQYTKSANGSKQSSQFANLDDFTPRELEIIRLIAEGMTNNGIAESLIISPRTVDTHRRNILQKLGVHNAAGVVKFAFRHDLVA